MSDLQQAQARFGHLEVFTSEVQDLPLQDTQEDHEPLDVWARRMLGDFRSQHTSAPPDLQTQRPQEPQDPFCGFSPLRPPTVPSPPSPPSP